MGIIDWLFAKKSKQDKITSSPENKILASLAVAPTGSGENLPKLPQGWTCLQSAHFVLLGAAFQQPAETDLMLATAKVADITGADLQQVNDMSLMLLEYGQKISAKQPQLLLIAYLHHANEVFAAAGGNFFLTQFVPAVEQLAKEVGNVPTINGFAVKGCNTIVTLIKQNANEAGD